MFCIVLLRAALHLTTWFSLSPVAGPKLPEPAAVQCVSEINSTHSFYSSGQNLIGEGWVTLTSSWIYDWVNEKWTQLDDMPVSGSAFFCLLMDGNQIMAVLGQTSTGPDVNVRA